MQDYIDDMKSELKRVDHIIYVSLKYTRTVDVIKHAIDRMISAIDFWIGEFLQKINLKNTLVVLTEDHGEYIRSLKLNNKIKIKYRIYNLNIR